MTIYGKPSSPDEREEARKLFQEWQEQVAEEREAASRASFAAERLESEFNFDVNDPPDWINEDENESSFP